jgi:hypothetical protein
MSIDIARLERDLRAAAATYNDLPVSGDAWQENQRRLGTSHRRRSPWLAATAAVVVLLLVGGALLLRGAQHTASGPPAGPAPRTTSPDGSIHLAGGVEAYRLKLGVGYAAVDVATSGATQSPGRVCSMFTGEGEPGDFAARKPVCSAADPRAQDPEVAFDYLMVSGGGLSNSWAVVGGAVDPRVASVKVWLADGNAGDLPLTRLPGSDLRAFAYTNIGPDQLAQRLVTYADGQVVQTVDLAQRFGPTWMKTDATCSTGLLGPWPRQGAGGPTGVTAKMYTGSAEFTLATSADSNMQTCVAYRSTSLAGWIGLRGKLVAVAGPEVVLVQVRHGSTVVGEVKASPTDSTPYQVAVISGLPTDLAGDHIVAVDVTGHVIDSADYTDRSAP